MPLVQNKMKIRKNPDLAPRRKVFHDILLVLGVLLLAVGGLLLFRLTGAPGERVVVLVDGKETASYALSQDVETEIRTGEQRNTLVIRDGKASVTEATCPDKICVHHRPISKVGETIVCLPHQVVVKVESSAKNDVDMVA